MDLKKYKSYTPSVRHRKILKTPKKVLRLKSKSYNHKYSAGRNLNGRITTRHRGGRHKRIYRSIDFIRNTGKYSFLYNFLTEYDPNRKTNISRVYTNNFKLFYIGGVNTSSSNSNSKILMNKYTNGDRLFNDNDNFKLKDIPLGSKIFNVQPLNLIKAPGTYGIIISKSEKDNYVSIKLPSKKVIKVSSDYISNIGRNDNINHNLINHGKAGARRWLGFRPTVKGNVMNAVDHPHGGNTKGGNPVPKTKWGKNAKWVKTRKVKNMKK